MSLFRVARERLVTASKVDLELLADQGDRAFLVFQANEVPQGHQACQGPEAPRACEGMQDLQALLVFKVTMAGMDLLAMRVLTAGMASWVPRESVD